MALAVLHLDDHLAIVDKPSGLIVHRGWGADAQDVMRALRDQLGRRVYPVHRLDRGTSGALAFALDPEAARALGDAFAGGRVDKRYIALVRGHPPDEVVVDHPIPGEPDGPRVPAVTVVRRLAVWERYALVEATPRTGRLHQVRRHLKHLSCPVIGDVNYGKGEHNRLFRERFGLHRLCLHALALRLPHPATGLSVAAYVAPSGPLARVLEETGLAAAVPGP